MKPWIGSTVAAFLALAATPTAAQSLTGAIAGIVKDPQGAALPGATISLDGRTGSVGTPTDARGNYRFPAIDPGTYSLRVEMPGFKPQRRDLIGIHVGTQLTIDFVLSLAGLSESVDVSGQPPIVDVSSPGIVNGLSQDLLFSIPFDHDASNLLNALPGVNGASAFGAGSLSTNATLLDGVDSRDPTFGATVISVDHNRVEEVEIHGLGAPAEYGGFTGVVVNTITRSGGNSFRGLFEARHTRQGLASRNVAAPLVAANPALSDPDQTRRLYDFSAQLGGPIRKNRLFFLIDMERYDQDTDPSGSTTSERFVRSQVDTKLTWLPGAQDHATASVQFYHLRDKGGGYAASLSGGDELGIAVSGPRLSWNLQERHAFGSGAVAEVKYLGWWSSTDQVPVVDKPGHYDFVTGAYSVSAGWIQQTDRTRHQVNLSLSRFAEAFGHHDMKFGLEIERGNRRDRQRQVGGLFYYDYGGAPYYAASYSIDVKETNKRESAYAQDAWKPTGRLTVSGGLRFDWIHGGDGNVFETRSLAPRIGVAFDLGGDRRSVLKASYGQHYEGALARFFFQALPGRSDYVVYSVPDLVEIGRYPSTRFSVAPGIRHPRSDQTTLAFERAVDSNTRFSAALIHSVNRNFIDSVQPDARWLATSVDNPLTGAPLTVYQRSNEPTSADVITNVDGFAYLDPDGRVLGAVDAYQKYDGLMLVFSRRLSRRWQAQASYVWSRTTGSIDDAYNGSTSNSNARSPNQGLVNADGRLTHSRPHELKVLASYEIPRIEVLVSGSLISISGVHYTPVNLSGVRLEPRGSREADSVTSLDLRFEKVFRSVKSGRRLGLYADIFNALNASPVLQVQRVVPSIEISGVASPIAFGAPLAIAPARQVVLGARWSF